VLSESRLPGPLAQVPTAREQGYDLVWPLIRGVYMGPHVPEQEYRKWVAAFQAMEAHPSFGALRAAHGLYPFFMTGDTLTAHVDKTVMDYARQVHELALHK